MKKLVLLLILLSLLITSACSSKEDEVIEEEPQVEAEAIEEEVEDAPDYTNISIFNGQGIDDDQNSYQALGIMIENHEGARPHSGLGLADIVYEMAVETYTITRFMAIFASQHPDKIGPVRSARIPFVHMIQEWGLPYAYYGAAARDHGDARSLISSLNIPIRFDGHQGDNDEFYFRDNSRRSPHNAFFNGEAALSKIPDLEYEEHFKYGKETNINQGESSKVSLSYSSSNHTSYEYDPDNNNYLRFINNEAMMDIYTDEQIRVKNIILQEAPHRMLGRDNYVLVDFIGQGKAGYFIDGIYEEGTWSKDSYESKTEYFNSQGNPIILLPGNTWIQVIHNRVEIEIE